MTKRGILVLQAVSLIVFTQGCTLGIPAGGQPAGQTAGQPAIPAGPIAAQPGGPLAGPVASPLPGGPDQFPPGAIGTPVGPGAAPAGGARGTAAENISALDATGALASGPHANDGRLTFTQYGGPTDGTPDANTRNGIGNRNNRLRPTSLALSPNLIRENGLRGGEEIYIRTGGRTVFLGHYDDTTGNKTRNNVIDVYDPQDSLGRDNFRRIVQAGQWELVVGQPSA